MAKKDEYKLITVTRNNDPRQRHVRIKESEFDETQYTLVDSEEPAGDETE